MIFNLKIIEADNEKQMKQEGESLKAKILVLTKTNSSLEENLSNSMKWISEKKILIQSFETLMKDNEDGKRRLLSKIANLKQDLNSLNVSCKEKDTKMNLFRQKADNNVSTMKEAIEMKERERKQNHNFVIVSTKDLFTIDHYVIDFNKCHSVLVFLLR